MTTSPRVAMVTGAAGGIGSAIATRLAGAGCAVGCADIDAAGAQRVAHDLVRDGGAATAVPLDIADARSVDEAVRRILAGHGRLDVLVNCAGIADMTPTTALDMAGYRTTLDINLDGAVALTLRALPLLRASGSGRVLNIASVQGLRGTPDSLAYATSKGGLVNFTRALAADLAPNGVMVNALAPGYIDTPMARLANGTSEHDSDWFQEVYVKHARIPLRRPGTPAEVAAAAEFFLSPENTYVTGQVLAVDGGLTAVF